MNELTALHEAITARYAGAFRLMEWAEDEISRSAQRHPGQKDLLWHLFRLLPPRDIGPGMGTEFVYRGHCRELLERAANGRDLRPATAAEVCLAFVEISLATPIHGAAAGLYLRMWQAAFPGNPAYSGQAEELPHYERLHGCEMDDDEGLMRRKLADRHRVFRPGDCDGWHTGEKVSCRYVKEPVDLLDLLAMAV